MDLTPIYFFVVYRNPVFLKVIVNILNMEIKRTMLKQFYEQIHLCEIFYLEGFPVVQDLCTHCWRNSPRVWTLENYKCIRFKGLGNGCFFVRYSLMSELTNTYRYEHVSKITVTPTTSDTGILWGLGGSAVNTNLCLPSGTGPT